TEKPFVQRCKRLLNFPTLPSASATAAEACLGELAGLPRRRRRPRLLNRILFWRNAFMGRSILCLELSGYGVRTENGSSELDAVIDRLFAVVRPGPNARPAGLTRPMTVG